ncbi:hypothetical protein TWF192_003607 [Orbilia oligospora]|uniref:Protein kinase domain-containing protein n=1 Tax=Orbilia oligospora TaxID=2813651 RepID=A0A6G1LT10_ORBOL|nr:hypothetical protein TWF191_006637 [Orbilia oligospora]KAF3231456.1 hypothetical protein TWF192_003607 [Orbilia oligospora]
MEIIEQLLSRPLPSILFATDNVNLQLSSHLDKCPRNFKASPIDAEDLSHWKEFTKNVKDTLNKTDLTGKPIVTTGSPKDDGEMIIVGNRYSLANRFQANVGAVLGAVFNASTNNDERLRDLRFGDSRVLYHRDDGYDGDADIMVMTTSPLLGTSGVECRVVGVFDVFWNPDYRYGFFSTYECTIFVKRTGYKRFDITDSIKFDDVEPTILQCFYYMGTLGAATGVLRSIGIKHGDPGPDNILWDKESGKLVMLDLEITWEEDRNRPADE